MPWKRRRIPVRRSWVARAPGLRSLGRARRAVLRGALLGVLAGLLGGAIVGEEVAPYVVGIGASGAILVGGITRTVAYVLRE